MELVFLYYLGLGTLQIQEENLSSLVTYCPRFVYVHLKLQSMFCSFVLHRNSVEITFIKE